MSGGSDGTSLIRKFVRRIDTAAKEYRVIKGAQYIFALFFLTFFQLLRKAAHTGPASRTEL